jgi:hypothetical protein
MRNGFVPHCANGFPVFWREFEGKCREEENECVLRRQRFSNLAHELTLLDAIRQFRAEIGNKRQSG